MFAAGAMIFTGGTMAQPATLGRADASMLEDIAHASLAEIEAGKIAGRKSKNSKVKSFAQMMVIDHTKALDDAKKVATAKNVELPESPDVMHKAVMVEFKALRGDMLDKRYVRLAGVGDHESTEKLLMKTQAEAKDADVKALAEKMLPVVQMHLSHARELAAAKNWESW